MSGPIYPNVPVALRALRTAESDLQRTTMQVATGKTVATVADDPAAYVIAGRLNSDALAFMAVNSCLSGAEAPTRVANAALDQTTDILMQLKDTAIEKQAGGDFAS